MRCCDILISPDTSFIHIASAIDLPTIGLYYKDNFTYWGPKSSINYVVRTNNYDLVFDKVAEHVKEIYVKLEKKVAI
jgi:ADP-heptose:LPS heptosyltransferase